MVDVPVKQATPVALRHPPIDTTMILNPDQATNPPSQSLLTQPNRSKTKRFVKKSSHPNPQENSSSHETRVYRLERKVDTMPKFNIQAVVDKSIEERLKHTDLPKDVPNLGKNKMEKIAKQKKPLYSNIPFDENAYEEFELKDKLFKKRKDRDSYKRLPNHEALFDALYLSLCTDELNMKQIIDEPSSKPKTRRDDHDKDPYAGADKHSKKRQKKPDSYKNDKHQSRTSKQGKSSSNPSKSNKPMDADEIIQGVETDAGECVKDAVHTPSDLILNKSKWWKESPRPATPETHDPD
ncbi:hypothetical protein Tco_0077151 [Tanacetum coccineum]